MIKRLYLVVSLVVVALVSNAQQDPMFSHYMFNGLYLSPGSTGIKGNTNITSIIRSQWTGYTPSTGGGGAPTTQILAINGPVLRYNSGVGIYIYNDVIGPQRNVNVMASYAYHIKLKTGKLGIGLQGGIYNQSFDASLYRPNDENDIAIPKVSDSQMKPDLAGGIWYHSEKLFGGLSVNHLLRSTFNYGVDAQSKLNNHMNLFVGYNIPLNYVLTITPTALVKSDFNKTQVELSAIATYNQKFWGGLSFRSSESITPMLGMAFLKDNALRVGYAFDFVIVAATTARARTSHEIMLSYNFPPANPNFRPIIRTPRFRHQ
jgi:type IX secretion system PorP/SprF family membrane protein